MTSTASGGREVRDVPDDHRYELTVDGRLAGFARYVRRAGRTIFVHTEIDDELGGQGLGSALAAGALDTERAAGTSVVPLCPFIAAFIDRHDEYADLVDEDLLARLDTP
ncbi:MAG: GNAT family N-acetyltransferase [Ilumatobacteraceae bacterium]